MTHSKGKHKPNKSSTGAQGPMQKNGNEAKTQKPKKRFWRDYDSIEKFNLIIAAFALLSSIATIGLYFVGKDTLQVSQKAFVFAEKVNIVGEGSGVESPRPIG